MQYLIYFAVATPLVLGWLFWQSANTPPPPPMFHSFADTVYDEALLKQQAEKDAAALKQAARTNQVTQEKQSERFAPPPWERTARAASGSNIRLR